MKFRNDKITGISKQETLKVIECLNGVSLNVLSQAHITAVGLRLGKKDLNLGNRVGSLKINELKSLIALANK